MANANVLATGTNAATHTGGGINYMIETPSGVRYLIYIDANIDIVFRKSTDGISWGDPVVVATGSATALAVWYDRWSNISAGLIHCAYIDSGNDDTLYRTIDTENSDALSTATTIFAGMSTAGGGALSITRAVGGNVYCKTMIDAGAEGGFFRLPTANVPNGAWDAARTNTEALATTDQWILVPGFAADTQDIMCIFWDASADEISRYIYDDSGNSWGETTISGAGAAVDVAASGTFPHFAAAVDLTNSQILVVNWTAIDLLNADLLFWTVTESAITAKTNVVTNSTDDQGFCAVGIDTATQDWYVFYMGLSDGSETFATSINLYYKKSTDDGATWGSETSWMQTTSGDAVTQLYCAPRFATDPITCHRRGSGAIVTSIAPVNVWPTYALGI